MRYSNEWIVFSYQHSFGTAPNKHFPLQHCRPTSQEAHLGRHWRWCSAVKAEFALFCLSRYSPSSRDIASSVAVLSSFWNKIGKIIFQQVTKFFEFNLPYNLHSKFTWTSWFWPFFRKIAVTTAARILIHVIVTSRSAIGKFVDWTPTPSCATRYTQLHIWATESFNALVSINAPFALCHRLLWCTICLSAF